LEADVDIVRDMLDKQVVDRNGRPLGRVDTVIVDIHARDARLVAIEVGLVSVADRLHPLLGRCARAFEIILGIEKGRPVRIPFDKVIDVDDRVKVDVAASDTQALAMEQLLRPIVTSIPGAR
jgi:sporulation protein YlmC with PRC-barrel domain